MKINQFKLKDQEIFEVFFQKKERCLSSFSFASIFIWQDFFDFFWAIIEDNLCVFAKNKIGCFMYLPPLGARVSASLIKSCFKIMDGYNGDSNISRIENIEEGGREGFVRLNLNLKEKDSEYLYLTKRLVNLSGNDFKGKRSACNFFVKNYKFKYSAYSPKFKASCLSLYKEWSGLRKEKIRDSIYQAMLDDNLKVHTVALNYFKELNLIGRVVLVEDKVKAYTFGFKLNKNIFCILLEVTDLSCKGLAQFIFREFCREAANFKFINAMDDSGMANLRRAKSSYHPHKLITSYIATR